jgi:hypothetical protein
MRLALARLKMDGRRIDECGESEVVDMIFWHLRREELSAKADPSLRLPHVQKANAGPQARSVQDDSFSGVCSMAAMMRRTLDSGH